MSIFRSTPRTVWWWSFGLLMAGPAFVLALLGLRSVRAERIEREQQAREEQTQAARLANAGISNALSKIERTLSMLDSAEEYNPPQLFEGHSISYFLIDRAGILTFPGDRVYFGEPPRTGGPANWPANLASLIDQARAAEAQGGKGRAIALYGRIMAAEPKLAAWAEMSLLRLDGKGYWQVLNAILTSESTALTPSGLPAVLVASAALEGASVSERRRYREIIERALSQLRAGQWWLSFEERKFYDQELRSLLAGPDPVGFEADGRLDELAGIARLVQAGPFRRDQMTRRYGSGMGGSPLLLVVEPSAKGADVWRGAAFGSQGVTTLLEGVMGQVATAELGPARVADEAGNTVWGVRPRADAAPHSEVLSAVAGWTLYFEPVRSPRFDRRTVLWLSFIGLLIVIMLGSLAGTIGLVRRESDLARMQSDFIAGVSHEFKNPISAVRLLVEGMASGRTHQSGFLEKYQAAAESELNRLESYVDRLIEAQRIEAGQRQYVFGRASLADTVDAAAAELAAAAEAKQIRIECDVAPGLPPLQIDRKAMAGALANLIGNAIKYSPAGSRINVTARRDDGLISLEVADEGVGIDGDDFGRIFDRFYRGKRSRQLSVKGSGLGLALAKAAVQAHGGRINVASEPGRGSRFTIRLPLNRLG